MILSEKKVINIRLVLFFSSLFFLSIITKVNATELVNPANYVSDTNFNRVVVGSNFKAVYSKISGVNIVNNTGGGYVLLHICYGSINNSSEALTATSSCTHVNSISEQSLTFTSGIMATTTVMLERNYNLTIGNDYYFVIECINYDGYVCNGGAVPAIYRIESSNILADAEPFGSNYGSGEWYDSGYDFTFGILYDDEYIEEEDFFNVIVIDPYDTYTYINEGYYLQGYSPQYCVNDDYCFVKFQYSLPYKEKFKSNTVYLVEDVDGLRNSENSLASTSLYYSVLYDYLDLNYNDFPEVGDELNYCLLAEWSLATSTLICNLRVYNWQDNPENEEYLRIVEKYGLDSETVDDTCFESVACANISTSTGWFDIDFRYAIECGLTRFTCIMLHPEANELKIELTNIKENAFNSFPLSMFSIYSNEMFLAGNATTSPINGAVYSLNSARIPLTWAGEETGVNWLSSTTIASGIGEDTWDTIYYTMRWFVWLLFSFYMLYRIFKISGGNITTIGGLFGREDVIKKQSLKRRKDDWLLHI